MEFCQLEADQAVFGGLKVSELTATQKREALRAVNLIKEERCGKLKGRTCAEAALQDSIFLKSRHHHQLYQQTR